MIKKLLHIALTAVLIFGTAGWIVNNHYSNGELYSFSLFGEAKSCCDDGEMGSCCSSETEIYQIEDAFAGTSFFQIPGAESLESDILLSNEFSENKRPPIYFTFLKQNYLWHSPPDVGEYLSLLQVYII